MSNLTAENEQLGLIYSKEKSVFRVWSPSNNKITLCIYNDSKVQFRDEFEMKKNSKDIFEYTIDGNLDGKFYTYLVGDSEITDPYSLSTSANSKRTAIIDLDKTNPEGFLEHEIPFNDKDKAIICETHVADISIDKSSNAEHRGLFLGACENGLLYNNVKTGIDHFEELGITHIHLLPVTDYLTVDENKPLKDYPENYNWGYDQELYNNMEGSFATQPDNPYSRIKEFKSLVKAYHEKGISVVLDVVYNHTFRTFDSNFNILEPNYYYRQNADGTFSNGSGCGNELASEKPMVRKFIIESLCYLAKEYKIDGYRFDLMALIDIDTIKIAMKKLKEINSNFFIYGEPWMALPSPLAYDKQILIGSQKNHGFAIFNPFFRDSIRGDNDGSLKGYLQGEYHMKPSIEEGISGSVGIFNTDTAFASPLETINYFNAHDNLIFQDKLIKSNVSEENMGDLTYMAFSILMTSQGLPFFHSGNSFMRTKKLDHNSYSSSSDINGIDWSLKEKNYDVFLKIKNIIELRKNLGIFNMKDSDEVKKNLKFYGGLKNYIISYTIKRENEKYLIIHNVSDNTENLDKKIFDIDNELKIIWKNDFVNEIVNEIKIERYSTNIYKI